MIIAEKLRNLSIYSCNTIKLPFIQIPKGTEPSAHIVVCIIEILLLVIPILHNSNYFCYYYYIC